MDDSTEMHIVFIRGVDLPLYVHHRGAYRKVKRIFDGAGVEYLGCDIATSYTLEIEMDNGSLVSAVVHFETRFSEVPSNE